MSDRKPSFFVQTTSFEPNGLLRGAQLTLVGAYRALQNPALFTSEHYRQAALAVVAGIAISVLVAIPVSAHMYDMSVLILMVYTRLSSFVS